MTKPLSSYTHPVYGDWLVDVQRPARYAGGELGSVVKPDAPINIALAFPDLYEIGMSHLGLRILYQVVNSEPDMAAERVFMPWPDMEEQLRKRGLPLVSLETAKPLNRFDVLGFSLQYELTYTNLLAMLDLGGIPIRSEHRTEEHPIVLAGGPVATHAEPIAPFVDLFVIGEAEATITELLRTEQDARNKGLRRAERIRLLDELPYCYAPALHPVVPDPVSGRMVVQTNRPVAQRAWTEDLSAWPSPAGGPVPSVEAVFDRISLEIMRGCTQGCRFCQAGILYRPVRELDPVQLADTLDRAIRQTGWDEASLTGLSPADHSHLLEVFHRAAQTASSRDVSLTVSSLRAYGLPGRFLDDLRTGRGGGLTFAPEAGTQRMRDLVNKNISAEDLLATARQVAERGWNRIKLYFMLGLPTETDEDLRAILELGRDIRRAAKDAARKKPPTVTCSLSTFVPKPHTPFQWEPMIPLEEVRRRQAVVRKAAAGGPVRLRFHEPTTSILEGILCRGDRGLASVVERAYRSGCRFDGWEEHLRWDLWTEAMAAEGIAPEQYLSGFDENARLPWDHIDVGVRRSFLLRERHKAMDAEPTIPCGQVDPTRPNRILCHGCGAPCDLDAIGRRYGIGNLAAPKPLSERTDESSRDEPATVVPPEGNQESPHISITQDEGTPRPVADADRAGRSAVEANAGQVRESIRIRLRYSKTQTAVLWGHLALVRHLPRTLRRAGLQIAYSQGFHPKPKIAYSPPLPVGWSGTGELADLLVRPTLLSDGGPEKKNPAIELLLCDEVETRRFVDRINRVAPPGIEILDIRLLGPQEPALGRVLAAETYEIDLPDLSPDQAARGIARLREGEDISITKVSKSGKQRRISLKDNLADIGLQPRKETSSSTVTMTLMTGRGVSPLVVCDVLFGARTARIHRTGYLTADGRDPFQPTSVDHPERRMTSR